MWIRNPGSGLSQTLKEIAKINLGYCRPTDTGNSENAIGIAYKKDGTFQLMKISVRIRF
jgi:hypothetical protein